MSAWRGRSEKRTGAWRISEKIDTPYANANQSQINLKVYRVTRDVQDRRGQRRAAVKSPFNAAAAAPIAACAQAVRAVPDKGQAGGGFNFGEAPAVGDLENRRGGDLQKIADMRQQIGGDGLFAPLQMGSAPGWRGVRDQARGGPVTRWFGGLVDNFAIIIGQSRCVRKPTVVEAP